MATLKLQLRSKPASAEDDGERNEEGTEGRLGGFVVTAECTARILNVRHVDSVWGRD